MLSHLVPSTRIYGMSARKPRLQQPRAFLHTTAPVPDPTAQARPVSHACSPLTLATIGIWLRSALDGRGRSCIPSIDDFAPGTEDL
jgi:hypothetical protein